MKDLKKKLEVMEAALRSAESYLCEDLGAICDDVMREYAEDTLEDVRKGLKAAEDAREPLYVYVFTWTTDDDGAIDETQECYRDYDRAMERYKKAKESIMENFAEYRSKYPNRVMKDEELTGNHRHFRLTYNGVDCLSEEVSVDVRSLI